MEYALIKNGVVANTIVADDGFVAQIATDWDHIEQLPTGVGIGWGWTEQGGFAAPAAPPSPEPIVYTLLTKLAFRNRFTQGEKVAIEIACLDDPSAPVALRQQAALLRASQADARDATFIDPQRADTRAGVLMLEQAGILGAGRALIILDTPVSATEAFRG